MMAHDDGALQALRSGSVLDIRRALTILREKQADKKPFRVSIVRTFTLEAQVEALELAFRNAMDRPVQVHLADLDVIEPELFDVNSSTMRAEPDAIIALWRLSELHPDLFGASTGWSSERRRDEVEAVAARVRNLVAGYREHGTAPLFISTFSAASPSLWDAAMPYGMSWAVAHLNADLYEISARTPNVYILDLTVWERSVGAGHYDEKMDYYARQPTSRAQIGSFATFLGETLAPLERPSAKVLALDLDNVLWGGVVGEIGVAGVAIGRDFPGNVYRRIQEHAKTLRDRGVALALVSKNDLPVVEDAFATRTEMVLSLDDFSAVRVNWEPKHQNLRSIAEELNVGIESFVFVDDQKFEQETVRYHLPSVRILDCGEDPLSILRALTSTNAFNVLRIVNEDRMRVKDYAAERERKQIAESSGVEAFLETLELEIRLKPIDDASIDRAHQMLHKTNQFNVTTPRHSRAELERMLAGGAVSLTMAMRDRFSDQGVIGLALAEINGSVATVDTFLMSCRALGRGAEEAMWAGLTERVYAAGARLLHARYVPTVKNGQVADLFDRFGMERKSESDGAVEYEIGLPSDAAWPSWIQVTGRLAGQSAASNETPV
jgi:FkbH-like protein